MTKYTTTFTAAVAVLIMLAVITIQKSNTTIKNLKDEIENISNERSLSPSKGLIVSLITPDTNLSELCRSLRTLVNIGDNGEAPIFLFDAADLLPSTQEQLRSCTDRNVEYRPQRFFDWPICFPDGIDLQRVNPSRVAYDQWLREQVERWWTSRVWERPSFQNYDVIMRISPESCFSKELDFLPGFSNPDHHFHAHGIEGGHEIVRKRTTGLYEFAMQYMEENGIEPANPLLWSQVTNMYQDFGTLPYFSNELEVVHKDFILRKDVRAWHHALTDTEPYGFYRYGWTSGHARLLTVAMFGSPDMVHIENIDGYIRKDFASGSVYPDACM